MTLVKCIKPTRWTVDGKIRDMEVGDTARFKYHRDAAFIVQIGYGEFITEAEMAIAKAKENKAAVPKLETGKPVPKPKVKKAPAKKATDDSKGDDA